MKVLVTGGAGYIGSMLVRELLEKGYSVKLLDTFFFGKESISDISDQIEIIEGDIRDYSQIEGVDAVIDLAAISNDPSGELNPKLTESINYKGRVRMAKLAKKHGVKRYILSSSCAIYGVSNGVANENSPVHPLTTYAKSNYMWEQEVLPLADKNFIVTGLRQATVFGFSYKMRFDTLVNSMTMDMFVSQKIKLKGDGSEYRPFIHIKDDIAALIRLLEADRDVVNGKIYNVAIENVKVYDLARRVCKTLGFEFNAEFGEWVDKRNYKVSTEKIKRELNFTPKHTIEYGIKEIYDAFKNGKLKVEEKHFTVNWYKKLISEGNPLLLKHDVSEIV